MAERPGLPVGRLVAEFLVIVTGVLVALFAESAWQERGERIEERETLERIADDLVADSILLEMDRLWTASTRSALDLAPGILAGDSNLEPEAQLAVLFSAALLNARPARAEAWDELVESGRTDLISDVQLRREITRYYTQRDLLENLREQLPGDYRADVMSELPTGYTDRVLTQCVLDPELDRPFPNRDGFSAVRECGVVPERGAPTLVGRVRSVPEVSRHASRLGYELSRFQNRLGLTIEDLSTLRSLLPDSDAPRDVMLVI